MRIVVITSGTDPHVQMVSRHLPGSEWFVFDPSLVPVSSQISYFWNGKYFEVKLDNRELKNIDVVWFRKPIILEPTKLPVEQRYQKYTHEAYKRTVQAAYSLFRDSYWVSDPWEIYRAGNKLLQQEIAFEQGFNIPETLVTNSAADAKEFINKLGSVVVKPLGSETINEDGTQMAFYATKVSSSSNMDFTGLQVAPTIFQRDLVGSLDVRVTVVGTKVYACEIHKVSELKDRSDWREGVLSKNLIYAEHTSFPPKIAESCVSMLRSLRIKFGAFDFLLDSAGKYWFLEINPNGQWGFVEEATDLPISKGLADLFESRGFV